MTNTSNQLCYVCGQTLITPHKYYSGLCEQCGELNYNRRKDIVNLNGYCALVTGGRLKVGFETAVRLLRWGARVSITTRFTADAINRFRRLPDFSEWNERLKIYPSDFRIINSIEDVIRRVQDDYQTLDILINNAAQTIRRPPCFYRHLLGPPVKGAVSACEPVPGGFDLFAKSASLPTRHKLDDLHIAALSQLALLPDDGAVSGEEFPEGMFDKDDQQEDRRARNSWMLTLPEIHHIELLEVFYINAIAPFLLASRLRPLMRRIAGKRYSYVVNVSAMEGNFFDPQKNPRHPHTNMAKAALNMMTRTCALDLVEERILMTSVDPGWITNERPFPLTEDRNERRFTMAIDEVDGAARICDPVFQSITNDRHLYGVLLKNYAVYPW